jgi:hypothetical protein
MDSYKVALVTARQGEPVGVQPLDEFGIAGVLIHQLGDREVQGASGANRSPQTSCEYGAAGLVR